MQESIKLTPMLKQWMEAKSKAKDALLLFRMGDFYELFGKDAEVAAKILDLALTSRDKGKEDALPMAGFPHHAAAAYIAQLIAKGHRVAICDQVEDPKTAKGLVRREITRIVTPGTVIEQEQLQAGANNFLVAVFQSGSSFGVSALDISTGEFIASVVDSDEALQNELARLNPRELLDASKVEVPRDPIQRFPQILFDSWFEHRSHAPALTAAGMLLAYVEETQGGLLQHLSSPRPYSVSEQLLMDAASLKNLDLDALVQVMDETKTAMGARLLVKRLHAPSTSLQTIERRLDAVAGFLAEPGKRFELRELLKRVYDIERLVAKAAAKRMEPRDLGNLRASLEQVPAICPDSASTHDPLFKLLQKALVESPPALLKEGGAFVSGYDAQLDEWATLATNAQQKIAEIETKEREETGIASLKIKYTRVFGYYIEVTRTHLAKVPVHYRRKQTVAGGERYVTPELSTLEEQIASADAKQQEREAQLFEALRQEVVKSAPQLLALATIIAELDVHSAFAELADIRRYCRPRILQADERNLSIVSGRHPVLEQLHQDSGTPFVPNDMDLDGSAIQLMLITGPNMAGKSTIMRQTALIQLLAQAGSFVPAQKATLSICDRIFTRVGAADDLAKARSTFMVEMAETAHILRFATPNSLVLLDEIGRGTSTFDGLSIAWAVAEYLHDEVRARTLFATHYHELTQLPEQLLRVKNKHVAVDETDGAVTFLYSLVDGPAQKSYGIHVAKLAGLPASVLCRANEILQKLEEEKQRRAKRDPKREAPQLYLF